MLRIFIFIFFLLPALSFARIVNRKVKEAPRVCAVMKEDQFLSRENKRIFGTLRNSLIIEDEIKVIDDLGKKVCGWPLEKLTQYSPSSAFEFYIDEFKNRLYSYTKNESGFFVVSANLDDCAMQETSYIERLDFPKCIKPTKRKTRSKKRKG